MHLQKAAPAPVLQSLLDHLQNLQHLILEERAPAKDHRQVQRVLQDHWHVSPRPVNQMHWAPLTPPSWSWMRTPQAKPQHQEAAAEKQACWLNGNHIHQSIASLLAIIYTRLQPACWQPPTPDGSQLAGNHLHQMAASLLATTHTIWQPACWQPPMPDDNDSRR